MLPLHKFISISREEDSVVHLTRFTGYQTHRQYQKRRDFAWDCSVIDQKLHAIQQGNNAIDAAEPSRDENILCGLGQFSKCAHRLQIRLLGNGKRSEAAIYLAMAIDVKRTSLAVHFERTRCLRYTVGLGRPKHWIDEDAHFALARVSFASA